jgi:hypothetical protein
VDLKYNIVTDVTNDYLLLIGNRLDLILYNNLLHGMCVTYYTCVLPEQFIIEFRS